MNDVTVAIIGFGYVSLLLPAGASRRQRVIGCVISRPRNDYLREGHDRKCEVMPRELTDARHLTFSKESDASHVSLKPKSVFERSDSDLRL